MSHSQKDFNINQNLSYLQNFFNHCSTNIELKNEHFHSVIQGLEIAS